MSLNQERLPEAIGESDAFLAFQDQLSTVAPVERPVLLIGERGPVKNWQRVASIFCHNAGTVQ